MKIKSKESITGRLIDLIPSIPKIVLGMEEDTEGGGKLKDKAKKS